MPSGSFERIAQSVENHDYTLAMYLSASRSSVFYKRSPYAMVPSMMRDTIFQLARKMQNPLPDVIKGETAARMEPTASTLATG